MGGQRAEFNEEAGSIQGDADGISKVAKVQLVPPFFNFELQCEGKIGYFLEKRGLANDATPALATRSHR